MTTPAVCPLCGAPSDCGIAAGSSTCWCFTTPIPAEVLERIPSDQRNRACVCRKCAASEGAAGKVFDPPAGRGAGDPPNP